MKPYDSKMGKDPDLRSIRELVQLCRLEGMLIQKELAMTRKPDPKAADTRKPYHSSTLQEELKTGLPKQTNASSRLRPTSARPQPQERFQSITPSVNWNHRAMPSKSKTRDIRDILGTDPSGPR
jgi:hypothetical protein